MKIFSLLLPATFFFNVLHAQNIGIGTNSPHASALLDVTSTSKGVLVPRMTTAQRTAITSPAQGLMVYDTDVKSFWYHNGTAWTNLAGSGGFSLPYEGTVNLANPGFKVTNSGFGPAIQAVTTNEFGYALQASNTTNYGYSIYAYSRSPNGIGVYAFVDSSIGVKGESGKGIGVDAISTDSTALRARIIKGANLDPVILATHAGGGIAVDASSITGAAVRGTSANTTGSIIGTNTNAGAGIAIYGSSSGAGSTGVRGESQNGTGVLGYSNNATGVSAGTLGGTALYASSVSGTALQGSSSSGYGLDVSGKVKIAGGNTAPATGAVLQSVDASGNAVWKPSQIAFKMRNISAENPNRTLPQQSTLRLLYETEVYDYSNNATPYTGGAATSNSSSFTAPVAGLYHFDAQAILGTDFANSFEDVLITIKFQRGGTIERIAEGTGTLQYNTSSTTDWSNAQVSADARLQAGDKVWVEIYQQSDGTDPAIIVVYGYGNYFDGHLVFAD